MVAGCPEKTTSESGTGNAVQDGEAHGQLLQVISQNPKGKVLLPLTMKSAQHLPKDFCAQDEHTAPSDITPFDRSRGTQRRLQRVSRPAYAWLAFLRTSPHGAVSQDMGRRDCEATKKPCSCGPGSMVACRE